jgi:prepilin-type N-terminal cleavage/methylation domain-containing protein
MKRKAFSLVELMLVVAILGILGAIVFPTLQGHVISARESAAKDNVSKMRAQIQLYAVQHKGTWPGYVNGAPAPIATLELQLTGTSTETGQAVASKVRSDPFLYGPYVRAIPENPFNDLSNIAYVLEATAFADAVDGTTSGWLYKKETGEFKLNWTGQDSKGVNFYDY